MKYLYFFAVICCISCQNKTQTEKPQHNENLIYFNSYAVAEPGDEKSLKLQSGTEYKMKTEYLDDIIYVSQLINVNACGNYKGDIEIKKDSLYLIHKSISDVVCTSKAIDKVTYIIKNPEMKKYKIAFKYQ
ncbi:hypothetical protein [Flavobacterium gelatinilyticum]|uniref:hypothetical protein n=1 Tax=Flavobacterium gelatinilyticum TaxID=3003260 RepID=UPI00247FCA5F|nr:hypothetical protein [Flavobacterium gelatinilyticum]